MTGNPARLYTSEVLALATSLADWPLDAAMPLQGKARSPACGSQLALSIRLDESGRIAALGVSAQACAIGQASAALFAQSASGLTRDEIEQAHVSLTDWLGKCGEMPDWPGLKTIAAAHAYPARHGALLLPWKAALDALP